ncbi:MAG: tRNA glutamyl-Q(34) synthetase GluQRS [Pseudomonadota bacterium]
MSASTYRGRFAPSPTGPLHFGSVVIALASYLDAKANHGKWFVRIDDLDQPRVVPGAESDILRELERLGLGWDGEVRRQRHQSARYQTGLDRLAAQGASFPCGCTRRDLGGGPYPGTCREKIPSGRHARSIRFRSPDSGVSFHDLVVGPQTVASDAFGGDFVIRRADGIAAYHLACVLDDAAEGITHIVRGRDLLISTGAQAALSDALGIARPTYAHLPVLVDGRDVKLSKRAHARPTHLTGAATVLGDAIATLGLEPSGLVRSDLERSDLQRSDLQRSDLQRSGLERSDLERSGLEPSGSDPSELLAGALANWALPKSPPETLRAPSRYGHA